MERMGSNAIVLRGLPSSGVETTSPHATRRKFELISSFWSVYSESMKFPPFSTSSGNFHLLVDQVEMTESLQISFLVDFWMEVLIGWNFRRLVHQVEIARSNLQNSILVDFGVKGLIRWIFHRLVDQVEMVRSSQINTFSLTLIF
jgi:hypothetical protein